MKLTQKMLKEFLHYNPKTGIFTWAKSRGNQKKSGDRAGSRHRAGYRYIVVNTIRRSEHRLAFLYMTGKIPKEVDHINHIRDDNRWVNLREANRKINSVNKIMHSKNTSGCMGVYKSTYYNTWFARIHLDGKMINLGTFKNKKDAIKARKEAEKKYGYHPSYGVILDVKYYV